MAGEGAPEVGSVECIVVDFPGSKFKGEIAPALKEIVDAGIVRILDLVTLRFPETARNSLCELHLECQIFPLKLRCGGQELRLLGDAHRNHELERLLHG